MSSELFEHKLKARMDKALVEPPAEIWDKIQAQLPAEKAQRPYWFWWMIGLVIILFLFSLSWAWIKYPNWHSTQSAAVTVPVQPQHITSQEELISPETSGLLHEEVNHSEIQSGSGENVDTNQQIGSGTIVDEPRGSNSSKPASDSDNKNSRIRPLLSQEHQSSNEILSAVGNTVESEKPFRLPDAFIIRPIVIPTDSFMLNDPKGLSAIPIEIAHKKMKRWSLGVYLSPQRINITKQQPFNNDDANPLLEIDNPDTQSPTELVNNSYSWEFTNFAVQAGLNVRYQIGRNFGVQSGLHFLFSGESRMQGIGFDPVDNFNLLRYEETVQTHTTFFTEIPLNLYYQLQMGKGYWSVYGGSSLSFRMDNLQILQPQDDFLALSPNRSSVFQDIPDTDFANTTFHLGGGIQYFLPINQKFQLQGGIRYQRSLQALLKFRGESYFLERSGLELGLLYRL